MPEEILQVPQQPAVPVAGEASAVDFAVPQLLKEGVPMLKVSAKKQKRYLFRLDPDQGQIVWQSKKLRIIPIENIKELRSGADARYWREQFQLAASYEDLWLTIVYVLDGGYKTLHLLSATREVHALWDSTLRRLYALRQKLMCGLGHADERQAVWERQFWRASAEEDQRLTFEDVERMCRRLNINPSREDLMRRFKQADTQNRGYLDFTDFKCFVKALKARPELDRLYKRLANGSPGGIITFPLFEKFMRGTQRSGLSQPELERVFLKYASTPGEETAGRAPSSPMQNSLDLAVQSASTPQCPGPLPSSLSLPQSSSSPPPPPSPPAISAPSLETAVLTLKGFTAFLLSPDNLAFADQHGRIDHDMTRPLPEYFISSSHNTYLEGHQLVGKSTVEGYIRALLHSCRSVELDIYDGDKEPVVYHGRTLTTKVSLRDTCSTIAKYAFVASPYPIIISAEIHCSLPQQDMVADIMREQFGDALVCAPVDDRPQIEQLPSPEDLKGRVLLKAKNLYVTEKDGIREKEVVVDTESSSTETSASDSDFAAEVKHEWRKARENEAEMIKDLKSDLKSELRKARNALGRVRPPRRGSSTPSSSASLSGTTLVGASSIALATPPPAPQKVKMSLALVALLVYTVGVKCRGLNKKEVYAPEHVFSLSETTANRILKQGMLDLVKHNRTHLVRIYPKGMRIGSTNYEPHRYWAAGAQLVALNWQTFDLGYMINHAMFQRNGRAGYVLKPLALRTNDKQLLSKRTNHCLDVTVISAQQLPRPKDSQGREIIDKSILDPFVEVSIHIPDWAHTPYQHPHVHAPHSRSPSPAPAPPASAATARTVTMRTSVVKNNGFNPVWEQRLSLPFDLVGDMRELVFVRFAVKQEDKEDEEPLAVYCASLGSLNTGYRHLPLHDGQLSQYLFSTLFVKLEVHDV
ncbi:PLC-like phosphodiesterase [Obba rivulosa]|uniref:Phosphoinositide phospholipase C n=1 Tax=Obba rivulosa TaxID=1052685 RepID=A0A8E2AY23_9APHY|nr:PLC-like phosphodiesterase [Obba rivulosa]